jgi:hypothetical protein
MAEDRTLQTAAKLHTAGPNILDRDRRLDLLGPAAFGSGPSRSKECGADLSWVERVDGDGYGEPNRDGDQPRCTVLGNWRFSPCYRWDTAPLRDGPFIREALRVSGVRFDGSPNSSYNE